MVHKTIFHNLCEESLEDVVIGSKIISYFNPDYTPNKSSRYKTPFLYSC